MDNLSRDTLIYFWGKGLAGLSGFLIVPLLIRGLGLEGYGQYGLWLMVSRWIIVFFVGWLSTSTLRYHSTFKNLDLFKIYWTANRFALNLMGILAGCAVFGIAMVNQLDLRTTFSLSISAYFLSLYTVNNSIAQAELKPTNVFIGDSLSNLFLVLAFALLMFTDEMNLVTIFLSYSVSYLLGSVLFLNGLGYKREPNLRNSQEIILQKFKYGYPFAIWYTFSIGQVLAGRFILQLNGMSVGLGTYTAFLDFAIKVGTLFSMPIIIALHGRVMANKSSDTASNINLMRRASLLVVFINLIILIMTIVMFPWIELFLFGGEGQYQNGLIVLIILTVGVSLSNFGLVAHKGLEIRDQTLMMATFMCIATIVNFVISWLTTKPLGVLGASFGWLVGNGIYLAFVIFLPSRLEVKIKNVH